MYMPLVAFVTVVLYVAAVANLFPGALGDAGMVLQVVLGVGHLYAVTAHAVRIHVAESAVAAVTGGALAVECRPFGRMGQADAVALPALLSAVAGGTALEVAHPVRLLPLWTVSYGPNRICRSFFRPLAGVANLALAFCLFSVVTANAALHRGVRLDRDGLAVDGGVMADSAVHLRR